MRRAIAHLKKSDPVLAAIIERVGPYRDPQWEPGFLPMARSIAFQQLNGKAATTIWNRLAEACAQAHHPQDRGAITAPVGENGARQPGDPPGHLHDAVTPAAIVALTEEQMRACGLSRQKLSYIRDLAAKTLSGEVDFEQLPQFSDDEVIEHLTRVKGIGVWSAQMFLMFALKRRDVLPTGDFGIRAAMKKHYRKRELPTPKQMLKISEPWRPYRSIACWYLWRSMDTKI